MNSWKLPTSLNIGGVDYNIRTDYRVILDVIQAFSDNKKDNDDKWFYCMIALFGSAKVIPKKDYEEAVKKVVEFIDMGLKADKPKPHTMDWEYDAQLVIPAINKVIGKEVRSLEYMHWWTFLGSYMEIDNCLFTHVLTIRQKRMGHKKLEKDEQAFYNENRSLVDLPKNYTEEEQNFLEELDKLLEGE